MNGFREWLTHPVTVRVCRVATGLLFAVAALSKLGDLPAFAEQIHNFRFLPLFAENAVAMTLPWIELVAALALLLNVRPRAGAGVAAGLMAAFTLLVVVSMFRGLDVECGCFGTADASRVGIVKALQNLGMLALAVVAGLRRR